MIVVKIVIKNYLSTSQAPPPQLTLIEKLVDSTNRKATDRINKTSLSDLKTSPSINLLKVRMVVCGQIQTLSSQGTAISDWESCDFYHRKSSSHSKPGSRAEVCSISGLGLAALHYWTYTAPHSNQSQLAPRRGSQTAPQPKTATIIKLY